ncbi:hypothetical protein VNO77_40819 [Canavalia gladiata]|uniref:Uncharacterized protein n=1 Tax=Canavalia gladiata TaxID=3824 RepID=A0AAN9K0H9_CANGL
MYTETAAQPRGTSPSQHPRSPAKPSEPLPLPPPLGLPYLLHRLLPFLNLCLRQNLCPQEAKLRYFWYRLCSHEQRN